MSQLILEEQLEPDTPGTNKITLYPKSDGKLYAKNDAGTESQLCSTGMGDVAGPACSTDNAVARYDSTTGKIIQNSGVIIDDCNNLAVPGTITSACIALVTISGCQTLTNKTIVVASNTITTAACGNLTSTELNAALGELQTDIDTRATSSALTTHICDTAAHGATGAVVGTTNTQTITNKTLTDPQMCATIVFCTLACTPGNPAAGDLKFYAKTDGCFYKLDSCGVESAIGGGGCCCAVLGPACATDNAITRFDTTTGKLVQNSKVLIEDCGRITQPCLGNSMFIGAFAGAVCDLTCNCNVAIGINALTANVCGCKNVAVGNCALEANTTGNFNTALGHEALALGTTGSKNVGLGYRALSRTTTLANSNVGVGHGAGLRLTTGDSNTLLGNCVAANMTTGVQNTAVGAAAGGSNFDGDCNVYVGTFAGSGGSGSHCNNIFVGVSTARNVTTGSCNIVIGYNIDLPAATTNGYLSLGNALYGTTAACGVFGNVGVGTATFCACAAGVFSLGNATAPVASPANSVQMYATDVCCSSELHVRDEAGNVTVLSPHNFSLIPEGPSEDLAWSYYSENGGNKINVDMLKLARMVEKLTGEKLVYTEED